MSFKQRIQDELDQLANHGGIGDLSVPAPSGRLVAAMTAVDRLACSFTLLALETDQLADADSERLQQVAQAIVQRMTYLLEPLGVLELDDDSASIQLRSLPPAKEEGIIRYYELVVQRGGTLTLHRYEKPADRTQPRRMIDAHVTREVFERLAADMDAAV